MGFDCIEDRNACISAKSENEVKNFALVDEISLLIVSLEHEKVWKFLDWCFLSLFVKIVLELFLSVLAEKRNSLIVREFYDFVESEVIRRLDEKVFKSLERTFFFGSVNSRSALEA